jgi:predicted nucleic acid-binding protein
MIVVDSNVIAYCWLNTDLTDVAQLVRREEREWHVPLLWRSEMRNVLAGYIRKGHLTVRDSGRIMSRIEAELAGHEHVIESAPVLELVRSTELSAYDCEFAALALQLDVPLVTEDRAILKALPRTAKSMAAFLQ